MTAFDALDALESALHPAPRFPVEPKHDKPGKENTYQASFRRLLRFIGPTIVSWSVPNAGKRGLKAQASAKKEGMKAGVADEHYAWNHGIAFLEWKDGKGDLSKPQIEWGNALVDRGFRVACVRTPEYAHALFMEWGAPVRPIN